MDGIRYADEPLLNEPGSAFVLPWGSTPGHGTFDVSAASFAKIQQKLELSAGCANLVMTSGTGALACDVTLQFIYLVSAEPVQTKTGPLAPGQCEISWRIHLADRRQVLRLRTISGRYNVLKPNRVGYFTDTWNANGSAPWTWDEIIGKLADALDIELSIVGSPAGNPVDIVWDDDSPLELLDRLLAEIGQYLTYNPLLDAWNIQKVNAVSAGDLAELNALLNSKARREGAPVVWPTRASAPASVDVLFPIHDTSLADERLDLEDRWYAVNTAAPAAVKTSAGTKGAVYYNHAYAVRELDENDDPVVTNAEALAAIATGRAAEFYARFQVTHADYELAGVHPLAPNSLIRRVIWVSDEKGARTLVRVHNPDLAIGKVARHSLGDGGRNPVEGDGVFIQRSGTAALGRGSRLEAERFGFYAKVTSHVDGAEYTVRRINQALGWIGAEFTAYELSGNAAVDVDTKVLVMTDGEGKFVFCPFRGTVPFIDCCKIDQANPTTAYPSTFTCTNVRTGSSGAPDSGTETRLLFKLAKPVSLGLDAIIEVPLVIAAHWTAKSGQEVFCYATGRVAVVTADFQTSGVDCATWNTKPAASAVMTTDTDAYAHAKDLGGILYLGNDVPSGGPNNLPTHTRTPLNVGPGLAYGVQISITQLYCWGVGIWNDQLSSAGATLMVSTANAKAVV